jgi:hypothetical protein
MLRCYRPINNSSHPISYESHDSKAKEWLMVVKKSKNKKNHKKYKRTKILEPEKSTPSHKKRPTCNLSHKAHGEIF